MITPTNTQLTELRKEKPCDDCGGNGHNKDDKFCRTCDGSGTGKSSITIPMEFEYCENCETDEPNHVDYDTNECPTCNGTGQTSKYKVGDVIEIIDYVCNCCGDSINYNGDYCRSCGGNRSGQDYTINLKIISINKDKKTMEVVENGEI